MPLSDGPNAPSVASPGSALPASPSAPASRRRIHLYRPQNQLGDLLLNVPAIRAVRSLWPDARIVLFAGRQNADAVLGQPWVDEVRVVDTRNFLGVLRSSLGARPGPPWRREPRPDLAIYFTTVSYSRSGGFLVGRSGARERVGFDPAHYVERDAARLTRAVPYPARAGAAGARPPSAPMHQSEISLSLVRTVAASAVAVPPPPYYVADAARSAGAPEGIAYLHPGAGKPKNRWPASRFAEVARQLLARGHGVALLEGPQDSGTADAVCASLGRPLPVVRGETIPMLAARFARAALYVGNDTGPLHLAGAVGCPTVGVYGWTDPAEWLPVGSCVRGVRGADGRLETVTARDVLDVALPLMEGVRCAGA